MLKFAAIATGVYSLVQLSTFTWKYYIRPGPNIRSKYGETWALVTGSTGGIGLGIAEELAAAGVNVVLVARNKDRLSCTADDLKTRYPGIEIRVVSADAESGNVESIVESVRGLDISLLINNVGVHNEVPSDTDDLTGQEIKRIIGVNCTFQVLLTSAVVPQLKQFAMSSRSDRGQPMVVNISSLTSKMAMPMLSVYAATKAFEEHWTEGLAAELQPHGVGALCLRPGLTVSSLSGQTAPSLFCPTARTMARACMRMLDCGETSVVPYAPHAVLDCINRLVPKRIAWGIVRRMHQEKRQAILEGNRKKQS